MEIIVCVKMIYDPEATAHYVVSGIGLGLEEESKRFVPQGVETVISPFDELAVEAALRIKDESDSDINITALCIGDEENVKALRRVYALGVDKVILIRNRGFEDADDFVTAHILAAAIKKIGAYDLILCGRQAADVDSGVVGSGLAELLDIPSITVAKEVRVEGENALIERISPEEMETIEMPLPGLVSVSSELGEPRYPKRKMVLAARKKELPIWSTDDPELNTMPLSSLKNRLVPDKISVVDMQGQCEFVEADDPDQAAAVLINKLREESVL